MTITVTDDQVGVYIGGVQLKLDSPTSNQSIQFWDLTLVSGDELNGVYTGTATMPKGSAPGVWHANPYAN